MTPATDFAAIASRAAARGIMVTAAGVEEIAGMLAPDHIADAGKMVPREVLAEEYRAAGFEVLADQVLKADAEYSHIEPILRAIRRILAPHLNVEVELRADLALWKREAADRSEGMIQLNLDRAALSVGLTQLREALTAVRSVRPSNWQDSDDPEQAAAWALLDATLQETARL